MGTISVTLPTDGTTADVSDYNTPINTIVTAINGNLDSSNISSLSGTKITGGTLPGSALDSTLASGWLNLNQTPNSVTYNGNRSYNLVFNSVDLTGILSNGMRIRITRGTSAPTQCTNLNGSTQYYSKSSPAGMTFTDDFVVSAWVKYTGSYSTAAIIASRYNGTSGWDFGINASGQIFLEGFNASGSNFSTVSSYQSLPVGRWVHVTAQLDMSSFTATTSTSYIMFNGTDIPAAVSRGGTNPTALVQAGNLEIGSRNGGLLPWPGKIAQVAIFNAKVTQSTIQGYISQGLAGTETSLISAYSFNNSINDLNANANNLTANGSAVATNVDSPFTQDDTNTPLGTYDFALVTGKSFSTNTTLTVQVPEGCAIPTSGTISAVSYSVSKSPYGFRGARNKWHVGLFILLQTGITVSSTSTWYNPGGLYMALPIGDWTPMYSIFGVHTTTSSTTFVGGIWTLSTANNTESNPFFSKHTTNSNVSGTEFDGPVVLTDGDISLSATTNYFVNVKPGAVSGTSMAYIGANSNISFYPAGL